MYVYLTLWHVRVMFVPPGLLKQFHDTDSAANMQSGTRFEDRNCKQGRICTCT